jgi:U3 small nucleolar RNA-associated protein 5
MLFTENGKYIISSAAGERHVTMWKCDGSNGTGAAACVLSMEHPAVALDCKTFGENGEGLSVLAVSEMGVAYIWRGQSVQELGLVKPSKVTVSSEEVETPATKPRRNSKLCIFAARLQDVISEDSVMVLVAYGNTVKPTFERVKLEKQDRDIILSASENGALLPTRHAKSSVKTNRQGNEVTALGPENAEDAILPIPRLEIPGSERHKKKHEKKRRASCDLEERANGVDGTEQAQADENAGVVDDEINEPTMEEKLMKLGILEEEKDKNPIESTVPSAPITPSADSLIIPLTQALRSGDNLLLEKCLSVTNIKVIRKSVFSMNPSDALDFLKDLVYKLKSSPGRAISILPWIRAVLLQHASYIMSEEASLIVLNTLYQMIDSRVSVFRPILQLSGRLDLIISQISPNEEEKAPVVDSAVVYEDGSDEDEELVEAVADTSEDESEDNSEKDVVMDDVLDGNKTMHEGSESE